MFVKNFKMTLEASGELDARAKIHYLLTLLHGKALRQLDKFSVEVGSTTTTNLNHIILGLGIYFTPINALSNQKCAMLLGTRNPHKLKVRRYADYMIELNEYLSYFPGSKSSEKIGDTKLNEILLNSIPNGRIKQAYVQGFCCESIALKNL